MTISKAKAKNVQCAIQKNKENNENMLNTF